MKAGDATRRRDPEMPEKATQFRVFVNDLDSISLDYYNASRKNELGKQYVDTAEKAFLAIAGDDETARANLQKMWDKDGHNIYTYNYAQPGRYLEHKQMQEEVILQKVFNSLDNDETIWNAIFGGIPLIRNVAGKGALRGGQTLSDYWGDVWANDLSSAALVNNLKDVMAIRYEEGKPVEIVAKGTASGEELEESVELAKFIANGSITGDELNWLMQNLDAIGDTDLPNSDEG